MTFKKLIKEIVKKNKISITKVRFEIAENIGKSIYTIESWEKGQTVPNILVADKLQRFISKFYKIDVDIYQTFLNNK